MRKISQGVIGILTRGLERLLEDHEEFQDESLAHIKNHLRAKADEKKALDEMTEIYSLISEGSDNLVLPQDPEHPLNRVVDLVSKSVAETMRSNLSADDILLFFGESLQQVWIHGCRAINAACNTGEDPTEHLRNMRESCKPPDIIKLMRDYTELKVKYESLKAKQSV